MVSPVILLALSRAVTHFLAAGAMLELVHLPDDAAFAVEDLISLEGVAEGAALVERVHQQTHHLVVGSVLVRHLIPRREIESCVITQVACSVSCVIYRVPSSVSCHMLRTN